MIKQLFEKIFKFYIESSLHVSVAVLSLLIVGEVSQFKIETSFNFKLLVFLASITGYNFVKYATVAKLHHRSLTTSLKVIQVFSLIAFLFFVYTLTQVNKDVIIGLGGVAMLTLLYAVPVFSAKNLRSYGGLKIYMVAFCWSGMVTLLPIIASNSVACCDFIPRIILHFFQVFVLVMALIIPFDIRDLNYDKESLKTIPQILGVTKAKNIAGVLVVFVWVIQVLNFGFYNAYAEIILAILGFLMIYLMPKKPSKYYCSFWIEALPIFYLGLKFFFEFVV